MMLDEGLLAEVRSLFDDGMLEPEYTASQAIGYKELIGYLKGEGTLDDAIEEIKLSSRRYAKRQLTWWRHHPDRRTIFVDSETGGMRDGDEIIPEAISLVRELYESL